MNVLLNNFNSNNCTLVSNAHEMKPNNTNLLYPSTRKLRPQCHVYIIQPFHQRLSHKRVKAYATMPIGIMGKKSLMLID